MSESRDPRAALAELIEAERSAFTTHANFDTLDKVAAEIGDPEISGWFAAVDRSGQLVPIRDLRTKVLERLT